MDTAIKIRKPKSQKKKWYFPNGVWIMIKECMGLRNSKFINKFLEPLTIKEKLLAKKIKNVLEFAEEYPRLWRILEAHKSIRANYVQQDELEMLCDTYMVDENYNGISDLKVLMRCLPKLDTSFQEMCGEKIVNRIKENMIQSFSYNETDEEDKRRNIDEKWADI